LYILSAPSKPEEEEKIKIDCLKRIMELSTKLFPYIIIDSTPAFTEYSLYLLDCANLIILVLNLDMPTVKNTRLSLDILERLGYKDKVKLVINRANTSLGLKLSQVRDAFADYEIISETPSDGKIVLPAVNQGIPFVLSHPKRPISISIKKLADWIISYK
jgi:pilus assembly protein CpaE